MINCRNLLEAPFCNLTLFVNLTNKVNDEMSFRNHVIILDHVTFVLTQNSRKSSNVGRIKKWRDLQRTPGQL